jgi:bacterioferritin-associated ferredoxin
MDPDDEICYCHHVTLRKLFHFARREQVRQPARMSECLGAGTGCGWCIPTLCMIAEAAGAGRDPTLETTPAEYAAAREAYRREKRPRHRFETDGAAPGDASSEPRP